ncbi:uncharacterized protein LOC6579318 [Drosophila mojavensis]|uniref:MD-2-related lipid-recognition domain-containing protein n=1 Tax=Drosophila mojavensis TaxID=7230 RepID=B4KPN9_DROMO|nr:uncharacterized protein LOC6579318 [Drosophila mojavensis]EDW09149.1 uncharacterized protein Dmoj_GI20369 [Drosophila mojavensis]
MKLAAAILLHLLLLRAKLSLGWALYVFTAKITSFESLVGIEQHLIDFRNISTVGEDHALNGTVRILQDMDPKQFQMSIDFQHDPRLSDQWRAMILSVPLRDVCTAMRLFVGTYAKTTLRLGENTNLPFTGNECPLPRGVYYVRNLLINTDTWPDLMPCGGFRLNMRFYKLGSFVGGFRLTLHVERKPL